MQEDTTQGADEAASKAETTTAEPGEPIGDPVTDSSPDTPPPASGGEAKADDAAEAPEADAPTADAPTAEGSPSEGLDPQLIVLCVILWLVAVGIFAFKWGDMRLDWYLGNIKESLDTAGTLPDEDVQALIDLGPERVVNKINAELSNPQQRDPRYKSALVRILQRIPGPEAFKTLKACTRDSDPRVRANAYMALAGRGLENDGEREQAFQAVLDALRQEAEPMARGYACSVAAKFKDDRAAGLLIHTLGHADGLGLAQLRLRALQALRTISGKSPSEIPFDIAAPVDERDKQLVKWEEWYTQEAHGKIPPEERILVARKRGREEYWKANEPSDESTAQWAVWKLVSTIELKHTIDAKALATLVKDAKQDIAVSWPLQLQLRRRSGAKWLEVRQTIGRALREIFGAKDGELPYDAGASEEKRYAQLQAFEDEYRKRGGTVPPGRALKQYRASEAAVRKLAKAAQKPLDKGGPGEANHKQAPGGS